MHRFGGVEPAGLKKLVRRCAATTPTEVAAGAFAGFHAAPDFATNGTKHGRGFNVRKPVLIDIAEAKTVESAMTSVEELR